jgi:hypothetical protein
VEQVKCQKGNNLDFEGKPEGFEEKLEEFTPAESLETEVTCPFAAIRAERRRSVTY